MTERGMLRLARFLDVALIPGLLALTYLLLIATSNVGPVVTGLMLVGLAIVLAVWSTYRELRTHAAASRLANHGQPDELLALADRELARRWRPARRVAFHVYRSTALLMRGDLDGAAAALADGDVARASPRTRRSWGALIAAQQVALAGHRGDAAAARAALERELLPALRWVPGAGAEVVRAEAEARVRFAEGDRAGALPMFRRLSQDIRLGAATRATCLWFAARCLDETDAAEARRLDAEAARLAPGAWPCAVVAPAR